MNLFDFYQHKIDSHALSLKKIKSNRNLITLLKLLSFGLTIWSIYLLFAISDLTFLIISALSLSGFVLLTIWDSKIVEKIKEFEALIQCNQTEIKYLNGDYTSLDTGDQYIDPTHPYSLDLDLFGEESLFQSINRTATHNGTALLADWLLTPSIDKKEIECRLEATGELSSKIDWCQKFRAVGSVYPTSAIEEHTITRWQKEGHYFQNSWVRYSVYILNTLMLISGGCALMSIMSYKVALMFFFLQLFITVLSLKKINNLHNHLGHFIKTIGNYFYLVKLINNEHFESIQLSRIKSELFKGNNSLSAFASLKKILGSFDQRSNVLVAALLNGLFMRDIHHAIKLDKWKTRYADNIKQWIAAVSETDALVSMANYRFNHPDYTVPKVSETNILKATAMGHPLLHSNKKVTNDFAIKSLNNIFIVTGANMAGKSTFLRTVGVNLVLALSGNIVCSREFSFTPISLFTSMRTTDNLSKGTSYFHAELIRLQALIKIASMGKPTFIILDEMLKGTNSHDKLNGSLKFLIRLLSLPVSGIVATHDLALGELAKEYPDHFFNVCFEIEHTSNDILYDYKLKNGVSKNMNASILLEKMGII